jgi:arylsulfatase
LEQQGVLDDTRLIFTSDHGEMFERGIDKHGSQALFQPEIRVPLMIYEPGQQERLDIYHNTSAVDILPTLLFLAGEKIPDWCEGEVLPPYNTQPPRSDREVFVVHSRKYRQGKPIERASLMIRKGEYKLTKFFGWEQQQDIGTFCEMYDVEQDPEELNDLYSSHKDIADELEGILDERLLRAEEEYLRGD